MGAALVATIRSLLAGSDVSLVRSFLQEIITAEIAPRVDNPPGAGDSACSSWRRNSSVS